jgi:hypothetical protein
MCTRILVLLQILAGELEPTTGEVILSAKALRVAFLKQEVSCSLLNTTPVVALVLNSIAVIVLSCSFRRALLQLVSLQPQLMLVTLAAMLVLRTLHAHCTRWTA